MFTKPGISLLLFWAIMALPCEVFSTQTDTLIRVQIQEQLEKALTDNLFLKSGAHNKYLIDVYNFYGKRNFEPWALPAHHNFFISRVSAAAEEGLEPEDYLLSEILQRQKLIATADKAMLAEFEVLITHSFLLYAGHLIRGKLSAATLNQQWHILPEKTNRELELLQFAADGHLQRALLDAAPSGIDYQQLKWALSYYRKLHQNGGWQPLRPNPPLKPGDSSAAVIELRRRLFAERILRDTSATQPALYDSALAVAVMRFQYRHGLTADGVIGAKTLAALNIPAEEKIRLLKINLERLRWLPSDVHNCDYFVKVNIAAFRLDVVRNGNSIMHMNVIVGKPYRKTPVFQQTLDYLVVNPTWTVPNTIATEDILPKLRRNPGYLKHNGIRLYSGWAEGAAELNPYNINWNAVGPGRFPYRLTADPGPLNPLGKIKFMFPNPYNVYMHDTPAKDLFEQDQRTFSSGCIRLSEPLKLAEYLLQFQGIDADSLDNLIATGRTKNIHIKEKPNVFIIYLTTWLDYDGNICFSPDVYGRNDQLLVYFPADKLQ